MVEKNVGEGGSNPGLCLADSWLSEYCVHLTSVNTKTTLVFPDGVLP